MSERATERVIVSGATSGIGRTIAVRLAGRAKAIGVMGRRIEAANEGAAEVCKAGCEAMVLLADVGDASQVESAVNEFIAAQVGLDTVVSSAGITVTMPVKDFGVSAWERIVATILSGTFYLALPPTRNDRSPPKRGAAPSPQTEFVECAQSQFGQEQSFDLATASPENGRLNRRTDMR